MIKFLKVYVPALSLAFTLIISYAAINNILHGNNKDDFVYFIIEVIGYLILAAIIDYLVSLINLKKFIYHFVVETVLLYPITIAFAFYGYWIKPTSNNFIWFTCIYLLVMIILHYYFYYLSKKQADILNKMLLRKEDKNGRLF